MNLAHGYIELFGIGAIEVGKVAVLVAFGILRFIFVPEKCQCDALSRKLSVDVGPDRKWAWRI